MDPRSRRSGGNRAPPPESVQRTALRAVCTIIDAFHFVTPGQRLGAAPLPQPVADAVAQHRLRQAAGLAAPGEEAVIPATSAPLLAAAPHNGTAAPAPACETNGAAEGANPATGGRASEQAADVADVRMEVDQDLDELEEPAQASEVADGAGGEDGGTAEAGEPEAALEEEGEADAMDNGDDVTEEAQARGLEDRVQTVLVKRVLPALLGMMYKV